MAADLKIMTADRVSFTASTTPITGIRKLAQRIVMELFTDLGSMQYLPHVGCNFLSRVRGARSEFDVYASFSVAKTRIQRTLKTELTAATPRSERLADMHITNIVLSDSHIVLALVVKTRDKSSVVVDLPPISLE